MARDIDQVARTVDALKTRNVERDHRWGDIHAARSGNIASLVPDGLPPGLDHSFVSNILETAARDLSELVAPLPSVNCDSANRVSERARKFSSKRTKIANYYLQKSRLQVQMYPGGDRYFTYGVIPFVVEPDFVRGCPMIRVDDPRGSYYELDLYGNVKAYAKVWQEPVEALAAKFPLYAAKIRGQDAGMFQRATNVPLEVIKYTDDDQIVLYLPERKNLVLTSGPNPLGKCPVVAGIRPALDEQMRGQFDEPLWIHVARVRMAVWTMEATKKNVQAPTVVPGDMQRVVFGPDAILRSNSNQKAYKLETTIPQAGFALQEILEKDIREGSRYPEGRSGAIDASIVTGQGVQALLGGFDTQVKAAQEILGEAVERVLELCFMMDEKFWPTAKKTIKGVSNGTPFEDTYVPTKDIRGNHTADVVYGFAAGMDPGRALVFMLQLRGDQLVPRDFVQRQLPMDIDVEQMQQRIDIEQIDDGLKQGILGMFQNIGVMVQTGQDPVALLHQAAQIIEAREKGVRLHEAILKAFTPKPAPEAPRSPEEALAAQLGGGGPGGAPPAVQAPTGPPDIATLLAGLNSSGNPQMSANVQRSIPV